jgi:ABC-type multidrug transport system fused ATPase/permease subunit
MKIHLTAGQKVLVVLACFIVAVVGFMVKLPSAFRHIDKELHAVFYFLAAALLNIFFAGGKIGRHLLIFAVLALFGAAIEFGQEYSNKFFRNRIHGRFDPEDLQWNLKGLLAFSIVWIVYWIVLQGYKKSSTYP